MIGRDAIVKAANRVARESRYRGAPCLTETSSASVVAEWLQWCDPNGVHTPDAAKNAMGECADDFDAYTEETVWDALADMLGDELKEETQS